MTAAEKKQLRAAISNIEAHLAELREVRDCLQDRFDGLSEKTRDGERGDKVQGEIDILDQAEDDIENAVGDLQGLLG